MKHSYVYIISSQWKKQLIMIIILLEIRLFSWSVKASNRSILETKSTGLLFGLIELKNNSICESKPIPRIHSNFKQSKLMNLCVNRFRITYYWKWRLYGCCSALYGKIGCCDSTSIDYFEMVLYCRFWLLIESFVGILVHCLLQLLLLLLLLLLQLSFSPTIHSLIPDYHNR